MSQEKQPGQMINLPRWCLRARQTPSGVPGGRLHDISPPEMALLLYFLPSSSPQSHEGGVVNDASLLRMMAQEGDMSNGIKLELRL